MNIVRTDTGELTAKITVEITPEDYAGNVEKELKNIQKKVAMPGFRPGKVPFGLVNKMYGKSVKLDEVNKVITDAINNYITENELNILGSPVALHDDNIEIDWDNNTDISFTFQIGFVPEFDIDLGKLPVIPKYIVEADDKVLNNVIESLRRKHGKLINPEVSEETDFVTVDFNELDSDGNIVENGIKGSTMFSPQYMKEDKEMFVGLKLDSEVVFDPHKVIGNVTEMAAMLKISTETAETFSANIKAKVTAISRMELAEINEDFFRVAYPYAKLESEEKFREVLKDDAEKTFANESRMLFEHNVREVLKKEVSFSLPDEFLKTWMKDNAEKDTDLEALERDYPRYENSLRMQLIENHIVKKHGIEVSFDEMKDHVKESFKMRFSSDMEENLSEEFDQRLDNIALSVLKNEDESRKIKEKIYDDKLFELYSTSLNIDEKSVNYDEFIKLANENHSH